MLSLFRTASKRQGPPCGEQLPRFDVHERHDAWGKEKREQRARTFFGCTMSWWLCHPSHTSPKSNAGTPTSRTTCSDISRIVCTRMSVKKLENVSCGASSPAPVWRQSSVQAWSQKGRARRSQWLQEGLREAGLERQASNTHSSPARPAPPGAACASTRARQATSR